MQNQIQFNKDGMDDLLSRLIQFEYRNKKHVGIQMEIFIWNEDCVDVGCCDNETENELHLYGNDDKIWDTIKHKFKMYC